MKNIVIFSGAGLSKESGIPTFRDSKDGLWHNYKVEDVATQEGWQKNKELVLKFYEDRVKNIKECQPNEAHKAIARLQEKYNVINITQNIDNLLERAGCTNVWHLHGSIGYKKCEWHRSISNLDGDMQFSCDYRTIQEDFVILGDLCPICKSQMRPDVVWFGEAVDMRDFELAELATNPDTEIFIGIGTSAQVHPAASLLHIFNTCKRKYFVDLNPSLRLKSWDLRQGKASEMMPKLVDELLNL